MWILDSTRIFVQDWKKVGNQIIPRLQPLAGGTVTQVFGYESPVKHLTCLVVGLVDREALVDMTQDAATHTLSGPYGLEGDFLVKGIQIAQTQGLCQTIRVDLDPYSPVYNVDIELYE